MKKKQLTLRDILKNEYKVKKNIVFIQLIYAITYASRPFLYICFPPLILNYIIDNEINKTYLIIVIFSLCTLIIDFILNFIKVPYQCYSYILPHQFNKHNLLKMIAIDYKHSEQNQGINAYNNSLNASWECCSIAYGFIFTITTTFVKMVLIISILFTLDFFIILFVLLIVVINFFVNKKKIKKNKLFTEEKNEIQRYVTYQNDVLLSLNYGKERRMYPKLQSMYLDGYSNNLKRLEKHNVKVRKYNYSMNFLQSIISLIQNVGIYAMIFYKYSIGKIQIGSFFAYIGTANEMYETFSAIADVAAQIARFKVYAESYMSFQKNENVQSGNLHIDMKKEHVIEFKNVSFTYPETNVMVLKNINLKIIPNKKLYLIGENGSGKTTLIKLLLKFYQPTEGQILLDGIDINHYDYAQYLKIFSVIFQDYSLYKMSIKDNICFDNYNKEKFDKIICDTKLKDVISHLPNQENTYIDKYYEESGVELSGGEMQKIAIARAVYRNASTYIFDEPTAALDPISEEEILELFNEISKNKTAIIVSHRMSIAKMCDYIIVLENGAIVEKGNFDYLIEKKGYFYKKFMTQSNYYD